MSSGSFCKLCEFKQKLSAPICSTLLDDFGPGLDSNHRYLMTGATTTSFYPKKTSLFWAAANWVKANLVELIKE